MSVRGENFNVGGKEGKYKSGTLEYPGRSEADGEKLSLRISAGWKGDGSRQTPLQITNKPGRGARSAVFPHLENKGVKNKSREKPPR